MADHTELNQVGEQINRLLSGSGMDAQHLLWLIEPEQTITRYADEFETINFRLRNAKIIS
jgi:hypothetical protein